jgi:DDE_Tnp_1-associated
MDDPAHGFVKGVQQCFHDLPDPRVVNRCLHQLLDILAIAILAVLSGADDWTDIEVFA